MNQRAECLCNESRVCQPSRQRVHTVGNIRATQAPVSHCLERVWEPLHEIHNCWLVPALGGSWAQQLALVRSQQVSVTQQHEERRERKRDRQRERKREKKRERERERARRERRRERERCARLDDGPPTRCRAPAMEVRCNGLHKDSYTSDGLTSTSLTNGSDQHRKMGRQWEQTDARNADTQGTGRANTQTHPEALPLHMSDKFQEREERSPPKIRPDTCGKKRSMKRVPSVPKAPSPHCQTPHTSACSALPRRTCPGHPSLKMVRMWYTKRSALSLWHHKS